MDTFVMTHGIVEDLLLEGAECGVGFLCTQQRAPVLGKWTTNGWPSSSVSVSLSVIFTSGGDDGRVCRRRPAPLSSERCVSLDQNPI